MPFMVLRFRALHKEGAARTLKAKPSRARDDWGGRARILPTPVPETGNNAAGGTPKKGRRLKGRGRRIPYVDKKKEKKESELGSLLFFSVFFLCKEPRRLIAIPLLVPK